MASAAVPPTDAGQSALEKELSEIAESIAKLDARAAQLRTTIQKDYLQLDDVVKEIARQKKLLKDWKKGQPGAPSAASKKMREISSQLYLTLDKLTKTWQPETGSLFVRFFLGQVNVKQYKDGERNIQKLEYEKFKDRTNWILLVLVLLQLFVFPKFRVIEISFQVWMLYYYVSLALRENILKVNGSNIKDWWIIHHYLSIVTSLVFIMFPQREYETFQTRFLYFSLWQSFVQNLMNRYQSVQLYKQIAMGKADRMDVTGDAASALSLSWAPTAVALLPFLLMFQFSQLVISWTLLQYYLEGFRLWQVLAGSVLFGVLGIGNIWTTLYTYINNGLFKRLRGSRQHSE